MARFDEETSPDPSEPNIIDKIAIQRSAPDDLRVISWPKGAPRAPPFYAYENQPIYGDQIIYLIDQGLDMTNSVSS